MKKILSFLVAAIICSSVFAAPTAKEGIDVNLPTTTPFTLDDFEEGMFFNAIRDSYDAFGNVFMKTQFSDSQGTKKRWDGKGNCGVMHYAALPGNESQGCIYECMDLLEQDWSKYGWISFIINNPNDYPVSLQMFTKTGSNWTWGNTDAPSVDPGTHTVVFKLNSNTVKDAKEVLSLGFTLYIEGVHPEGEIYIDDITLWTKK